MWIYLEIAEIPFLKGNRKYNIIRVIDFLVIITRFVHLSVKHFII